MKLRQIVSHKKRVGEFEELPREIVEKIPDCRDDERVVRAYELMHRLRREKDQVIGDLSQLTEYGPSEPPHRSDAEVDAQKLLAGEELASISGPDVATARSLLIRRLDALQIAVPASECRVQELCVTVIQENSEKIKKTAEFFEHETLRAFSQLLTALQKQSKFYRLLSQRGFARGARPNHWQLINIEQILLFGGVGMYNLPSIEYHIADRKKHWKFNGKKE